MDWKAEAVERLRGYEAQRQTMERITLELERLGTSYAGIRGARLAGMPKAGSGASAREDYMLNNITRRDDLRRKLKEAQLWVAVVDSGMSILDEEERLALELCFIHKVKGSIEDLCERLNVERSTAYRRRDEALQRFTIALYGAV